MGSDAGPIQAADQEQATPRLSARQLHVLGWLWNWTAYREATGGGPIEWHAGRGLSPTARASISRTLRRLAARGLVERHRPHGRTLRVRLTPAGWALAVRCVGGDRTTVNRGQQRAGSG